MDEAYRPAMNLIRKHFGFPVNEDSVKQNDGDLQAKVSEEKIFAKEDDGGSTSQTSGPSDGGSVVSPPS